MIELSAISKSELQRIFASFDHVLCDNDGVLSLGGRQLPGAADCLHHLQTVLGKRVTIVSNNTVLPREMVAGSLRARGVHCTADDIITPACVIVDHLRRIAFTGKLWVIGYGALRAEFINAGFACVDASETEPKAIPPLEIPKYMSDFDADVKAIVVDFHLDATMMNIAKAISYIERDPDVQLLFGGTDRFVPLSANTNVLGPGPLQQMIVDITRRRALAFGKPADNYGKYLIDVLKCVPERTLFIGDSLQHDIAFAKQLGFQQLLVLTGNTKPEDLTSAQNPPQYHVDSLQTLWHLLT